MDDSGPAVWESFGLEIRLICHWIGGTALSYRFEEGFLQKDRKDAARGDEILEELLHIPAPRCKCVRICNRSIPSPVVRVSHEWPPLSPSVYLLRGLLCHVPDCFSLCFHRLR